ncbi:MAG TPA: PEP/pyruvate-binding domain-containing protein, partial [Candidatus Levybacteria bacterium]|nr:PEP/pyruvate-binding domain-containing protein [Candidatus Levybacteria bacterium]
MVRQSDLVVWLKDIDREDIHLVGEKSANLGEMIQSGFPVPAGFVLTATAYTQFIRENKLEKPIAHL